jgi:hypothetical protein
VENSYVLTRERFDAEKRLICATGLPSSGDNLLAMEMDCFVYLGDPTDADGDPDLWHDMAVSRSEGAEWIITGAAAVSAGHLEFSVIQRGATDCLRAATKVVVGWSDERLGPEEHCSSGL